MAAPGAGGGSGAQRGGKDGDSVKSSGEVEGGLRHGQDSVNEAVPGGTIARNRPDTTGGKAA